MRCFGCHFPVTLCEVAHEHAWPPDRDVIAAIAAATCTRRASIRVYVEIEHEEERKGRR